MRTFDKIDDIKKHLRIERDNGKKIGFVPTMGYLHEGHLSLIQKSAQENDITVVSIFVNPTQFGPGEDLDKYPRNIDRDTELAHKAGADILFVPGVAEMYPEGYNTYVEVGDITDVLCGASRPGHFRGVTTVVTKLFNIVGAHRAYFGQKDAQQAIVIQKMVRDLDMDVSVVVCPIIREKDGLAMSSRNVYLSMDEREQATILYKALKRAEGIIIDGERKASRVKKVMENLIGEKPLARIDYISIVNGKTLKEIEIIEGRILIALAVRFGNTRLIDNAIMEV